MTPLFNKLNLGIHREILVIDAPEPFEPELAALAGVTVKRSFASVTSPAFVLAFVQTQAEVAAVASSIAGATHGDTIAWLAYPKASSKRYRCEFNRDTGWSPLGAIGFEGVRQVAIDDDWSALRFRRVEYVKTLQRAEIRASSEAGKARVWAQQAVETPAAAPDAASPRINGD